MHTLRSLGLMFLSILWLIGYRPSLLTPGIGLSPQKNRRYRHDGATSTLKANQLRDGAGTIFRSIASLHTRCSAETGLRLAA